MNRGRFDGLTPPTRRWLEYEQTVNERLTNDAYLHPIDRRSNTVKSSYWPEQRGQWPQEVVWLPPGDARRYGALAEGFSDAFGHDVRDERTPLLLHPQAPLAHRQLASVHGRHTLADVWATPTASFRSVLACRHERAPVVLKLSLGAVIGRTRRRLRENQVARAVLMSTLFDTIPRSHRARLGFDWFAEPTGMVETASGHGWLLRTLPRTMAECIDSVFVPMFSLISPRGEDPPLLVDLIRRSGQTPEAFVFDTLIVPYVEAIAYLLFVQGIQVEGHTQNVLVEVDDTTGITKRLVFRDLSDSSISIPLRIARRKPLPVPAEGYLPADAPFPLGSIATDFACNFNRATLCRAFDTVERYGLWGFLWAVNTSLARYFPSYRSDDAETAYLTRWQEAAQRYLDVTPMFMSDPRGLATDETLAYFLNHVDWKSLGAVGGQQLPTGVEPLRTGGPPRRRSGPVYDRVECAWGDVFLFNNLPVFFRPAF